VKHYLLILLIFVMAAFSLVRGAVFAQDAPPPAGTELEAAALQAHVGTAFTYQDQLTQNGATVSATCDFEFSLFDANSETTTGAYGTISGTENGGNAASGFTIDLILPVKSVPNATDQACRYTGIGQIQDLAISGHNNFNETVTRNGVNDYPDWTLGDFSAPTAVVLLSFDVVRVDVTTLRIEWSTASELNALGFHLWRSGIGDRSQAARITAELIAPQGSLLSGAEYIFVDGQLQPDTPYYYWLQEVETGGSVTEYGPVTGRTPALATIAVSAEPAAGGTVSGGGTVTHGDTVTVTATAGTGYTFLKWTENDTEISTKASYSFTAEGERTLVAHFSYRLYLPLILSKTPF
jgi:hypothetical protein